MLAGAFYSSTRCTIRIMYFTAVASLVPLQGEIPLKLGSGARLYERNVYFNGVLK